MAIPKVKDLVLRTVDSHRQTVVGLGKSRRLTFQSSLSRPKQQQSCQRRISDVRTCFLDSLGRPAVSCAKLG